MTKIIVEKVQCGTLRSANERYCGTSGRSACCRHVLLPRSRTLQGLVVGKATNNETEKDDSEETTLKYGLEAGLWKVFTSPTSGLEGKSRGEQAKDLLKRYGSAYLVTSISFAIVSFATCYALVNAGVDVAAILSKVGLQVSDTSEKVGTFAIAYAAHKALSPVRFPPTVALTPVVAKWLGKTE
ncbi:hypothetical protein M9434_006707 [Picochlorum sp. BPE23]|nr:hypothetical protein M9434_006707 [Picochlorum sp. BPE23]